MFSLERLMVVVANLVVVVGKACAGYMRTYIDPLVDGDVEEVGELSLESMEDEEVATVDGVFKGAFGALGLEVEALVDAMKVMVVDDE
nr:hypothetical protein [Tanacetum cinerariifolium]